MKDYTIIYKDKPSEQIEVADKSELIEKYFNGDEEQFKREVSRLLWSDISNRYIYDVETGKTSSEVSTADANPYGWRQGESG